MPWQGASIALCEESCTLTNPVTVRGMDATLYDFACVADYDTPMAGRVMLLRQDGGDGARLSLVTRRETIPVVPCPR